MTRIFLTHQSKSSTKHMCGETSGPDLWKKVKYPSSVMPMEVKFSLANVECLASGGIFTWITNCFYQISLFLFCSIEDLKYCRRNCTKAVNVLSKCDVKFCQVMTLELNHFVNTIFFNTTIL